MLSFNDPFRFFTKGVLFHPAVKSHISEENHWLKISPLHTWNIIHTHFWTAHTVHVWVNTHSHSSAPGSVCPQFSWSPANVLLVFWVVPFLWFWQPICPPSQNITNTPLYLSIWQSEVKWLDHECEWPSYPVVPCAVHLWTAIVQLEKTSNIVPSRTGDAYGRFLKPNSEKHCWKQQSWASGRVWVNSSEANQINGYTEPAIITIHSVANILTHFCPGLFMVSRFLVIHFYMYYTVLQVINNHKNGKYIKLL